MKLFNLEIITPETTLYQAKAISLVAPAEFGYLGVLAGHAPLITNLAPGKITVRTESEQKLTFNSKERGFLQVLKNNVTLLLDK